MNHSTYLFGNFGLGYTQYPDDFTKELLSSCVLDYAKTSISICRDGNIIYYIYVRKLYGDDKKYIGIVISYNDVYIDDLNILFSVFENCISNIVLRGELLEFNYHGEIQAVSTKLYYKKAEFDWISTMIDAEIKDKSFSYKELPVLNYSINRNDTYSLTESASAIEVTNALNHYSIIRVLKNSDYDSLAFKGYASKLRKLYEDNQILLRDNDLLTSELKKEKAKKKQLQVVAILGGLLLLVLVLLFSLNSTLNIANRNIEKLNKENILQSDKVRLLGDENANLKGTIVVKEEQIVKLENDIEFLEGCIVSLNSEIKGLKFINNVQKLEIASLKNVNTSSSRNNKNTSSSRNNKNASSSRNNKNLDERNSTAYSSDKSASQPYINPSKITLEVGEFYQLRLYPISLQSKITKWEADNNKVVTVSSEGKLLAKKKGSTFVWVFYQGGCKMCTVIVK